MKIQKFEDIIAWQKAQLVAVEVYETFSNIKDYGFKDQITRASVSISNNIAEGFDRSSDADFARFLYIAIGSASELKSMLYLAAKIGHVDENKTKLMIEKVNEVSKIIRALIKSITSGSK